MTLVVTIVCLQTYQLSHLCSIKSSTKAVCRYIVGDSSYKIWNFRLDLGDIDRFISRNFIQVSERKSSYWKGMIYWCFFSANLTKKNKTKVKRNVFSQSSVFSCSKSNNIFNNPIFYALDTEIEYSFLFKMTPFFILSYGFTSKQCNWNQTDFCQS